MMIINKFTLLILVFLSISTLAAKESTCEDARQCFNQQEYKKAIPYLEEGIKHNVKSAMYQLAYIYQNGLEVDRDYQKAAKLYQKAASNYKYVLKDTSKLEDEKKTFVTRVENQINPKTDRIVNDYSMKKLDTNTPETKKLVNSYYDGSFFGILPYDTNYVLPVSYASSKYKRISAGTHYNNYTPQQQEQYGKYSKNYEVEFQISLKKPLTYDLFGLDEVITFAYTQKVWWQLYASEESAPFRETNYIPELFVTVPTSDKIDERINLKAVKYGYIHESNGQDGYRSRSWNRLHVTGMWQFENLFLSTRVWYRFTEDEKYYGYYDGAVNPDTGVYEPNDSGDDNPNIENYLGYGDVKLSYLYGKHKFNGLFRYNFGAGSHNRGAVDLSWSYPFLSSKNTFWYAKVFSGYGESLIDYDNSVTKTSFGFSFSRAPF